jgi:hypothetical protein
VCPFPGPKQFHSVFVWLIIQNVLYRGILRLPLCILSGLGFGKLPTLHFFIVCCETQLMQEDFDIHTNELFCASWLYELNLYFYFILPFLQACVLAYEVKFFKNHQTSVVWIYLLPIYTYIPVEYMYSRSFILTSFYKINLP